MPKDEEKRQAARAALRHIEGCRIVGVGTGSTVAHFIDALAERRTSIDGCARSRRPRRRASSPRVTNGHASRRRR